jgi:AcrR family transcriptional regulator
MGSASGDPGGSVATPAGPEEDLDTPRLRADARRNRVQILAAAEAVFSELGVGVPIDEVARRAGVGVGTLYRHFPTKEALFEAVIRQHIERITEEGRARLDSEQPGRAFFEFLALLSDQATAKRALIDALSGAGINLKTATSPLKVEFERVAEQLLLRAQEAGQVRADVRTADVFALVMGACMSAGYSECSGARMVSIVCDGLRSAAPDSAVVREARQGRDRVPVAGGGGDAE